MSETRTDFELLRDFVRRGDQSAFAGLVRRHLNLVYATALRKIGDAGAAEEVAQNVFNVLAKKAWRFAPDDSLPAWLYKTTLLEAKEWVRGELRRRRREQTAAELGTTMKNPDEQTAFRALLPLLDEALLSLREKDRTALLLRFYESQSLREVGAALGVSEDTAQKRVAIALENVSRFFHRCGFRTASVGAAAAALQQTAVAAPASLGVSITAAAIKAAPMGAGLTVLLGRLFSLSKAQILSVSTVALAVAGIWYWQLDRTVRAREPLSNAGQTEIAQGAEDRLATPRTSEEASAAEPEHQSAAVAPAASTASQAQTEFNVRVRLAGFVNIPDRKIALLEIRRPTSSDSTGAWSTNRAILSEGKEYTLANSNERLRIEFLHADFKNLKAQMRENGKDVVYTMDRMMPQGEWNMCLGDADFNQVVDLYAELMNRTTLCHPQVKPVSMSVAAEAKDRDAIIAMIDTILQEQAQTATIMDGEKFALLVPTNLVKSASSVIEKIPHPTPDDTPVPQTSVNFVGAPMSVVMEVYGSLISRESIPGNYGRSTISFHNQTALTKPEIAYALNVLFNWQGWEPSFVGEHQFKMVPTKSQ